MALETATYIDSLVTTNPDGGDLRTTVDDHIRLVKACLKRTFPNVTGEVSVSHGVLNGAIRPDVETAISATWSFANQVTLGGVVKLSGVVTPAQITANQNDYSPTGLSGANWLRLSSDASRSITGLAGGSEGRILIVSNVGSQNINFLNEDTGSSEANRFVLLSSAFTAAAQATVVFQYDGTSSRWRILGS